MARSRRVSAVTRSAVACPAFDAARAIAAETMKKAIKIRGFNAAAPRRLPSFLKK